MTGTDCGQRDMKARTPSPFGDLSCTSNASAPARTYASARRNASIDAPSGNQRLCSCDYGKVARTLGILGRKQLADKFRDRCEFLFAADEAVRLWKLLVFDADGRDTCRFEFAHQADHVVRISVSRVTVGDDGNRRHTLRDAARRREVLRHCENAGVRARRRRSRSRIRWTRSHRSPLAPPAWRRAHRVRPRHARRRGGPRVREGSVREWRPGRRETERCRLRVVVYIARELTN